MRSPTSTPNSTITTAQTEPPQQTDQPDIINDDEFAALATMALAYRPHTDCELKEVVKWAERVRYENLMLDMVLDRQLCAFFCDDGQIRINIPPEHREQIEGKLAAQDALQRN